MDGRIAGIDFGTKRIGIAITDSQQRIASPLDNYTRRGVEVDAAYFRRLAADEDIRRFVVGLPVYASGDESQSSQAARSFGKWLHEITGVEVVYFDERYTSAEAERLLADAKLTRKQRKIRLDKLAAQILLTAYLESSGAHQQPPAALDD